MKIILASQNKHKIDEINDMLHDLGYNVVSMSSVGIEEDIPENGVTMEENAMIKARFVYAKVGEIVLADDSGLEVEALDGAPGVYSARYAGPDRSDHKNMDKLIENLHGIKNRNAQFKSVLAYINHGEEFLFEGVVRGDIIDDKRGANGFGYDPIFVPKGHQKTFAQLSSEEKNSMSHRANALAELIKHLKKGEL